MDKKSYSKGFEAGAEKLIQLFVSEYNRVHNRTPYHTKKLQELLMRVNNVLEAEKKALNK